jgi:hypothetical protein
MMMVVMMVMMTMILQKNIAFEHRKSSTKSNAAQGAARDTEAGGCEGFSVGGVQQQQQ